MGQLEAAVDRVLAGPERQGTAAQPGRAAHHRLPRDGPRPRPRLPARDRPGPPGQHRRAGAARWAGPSPCPTATGPSARSPSSATGSPACSGGGSRRRSSSVRRHHHRGRRRLAQGDPARPPDGHRAGDVGARRPRGRGGRHRPGPCPFGRIGPPGGRRGRRLPRRGAAPGPDDPGGAARASRRAGRAAARGGDHERGRAHRDRLLLRDPRVAWGGRPARRRGR